MIINDIKRISKNSIGFSIGLLLTNSFHFFLLPIYTRFLTPSDYGVISVAAVVSTIFSILCIFGMRNAIGRFYYDYYQEPKELKIYLSTICITVFIVSLFLTIFLFLFGEPVFTLIIPDVPFSPYFVLTLWSTFFMIPFNFALILLQVRERSFFYSMLNVAKFLLTTSLIIYFVVFLSEGAFGSLKGEFLMGVIFFFIGIILLSKDIGWFFDLDKLKESLSFGLPMVPHELAGWVFSMTDRIFLSYFSTLASVGIYSLGYQVGGILRLATSAINFAWVPFFMSTAKEGGEDAIHKFSVITSYYCILLFFLSLCVTLYSDILIQVMTVKDYYEASNIVPIIVLGNIFGGMYYMVVNQLFFLKFTKYVMYSTVTAASLNICLNFIFIPHLGMYGAGIVNVTSFGLIFLFVFYFSRKFYPIPYEYNKIGKIIVLAFMVYLISFIIPELDLTSDFFCKSLLLVGYGGGLFILKILSKEELHILKRYILKESG